MAFNTHIVVIVISLLVIPCGKSNAQLRLPIFDVEFNVHQNLIPGGGEKDGDVEFVETTNIYGGGHIQLNQYVALGGFYSRSFRGKAKIHYNNNSGFENEALLLQKGLDARLSTGRAKKWRHYLAVSYFQIEMVEDLKSFRLADKTSGFGLNIGMMRRLSNNLYLNVIELGIKSMADDIFWFGGTKYTLIVDAKMGLTCNIGKKK